jgi:hypothetical protein
MHILEKGVLTLLHSIGETHSSLEAQFGTKWHLADEVVLNVIEQVRPRICSRAVVHVCVSPLWPHSQHAVAR